MVSSNGSGDTRELLHDLPEYDLDNLIHHVGLDEKPRSLGTESVVHVGSDT
jgi:hypothetical protein